MVIIAVLSPILGTIADFNGRQEDGCSASSWRSGSRSVAAMFFIHTGDWLLASVLFILANIGANGSFVFYDALLPHIARDDEIDRVSTAGYALGYVGGGLLLALNLAWIMKPAWFGLPSGEDLTDRAGDAPGAARVPLGRGLVARLLDPAVPPRPRAAGRRAAARSRAAGIPVRRGVRPAGRRPFRELRRYRQGFLMLLAFLIYNDGIGTIIRMADDLRRRDRDRPGRDDRLDPARPVRRASRSRSSSGCWRARSAPSGRSCSGWWSTRGSASSATS